VDPVVFLDRDNTLIANDGDLGDPSKVKLLPGVAAGLRTLKDAGFRLVVVTNQGGVARGRYSESDVDRVHAAIARLVDEESGGRRVLDRFYYCPFHPEGTHPDYRREHPWRKPQPGMLLQAAADMALDLDRGWMVGDQPRDVLAGRAAGCRTVLLASTEAVRHAAIEADFVCRDFEDAVETILWHRMNDANDAAKRAAARARSQLEAKPAPPSGAGGLVPPPSSPSASSAAATPTATATKTRERREDARRSGAGAGGRDGSREGARVASRSEQRRDARRGAKAALEPLRRALVELVEEVRTDRTRRGEFGPLRMAAAALQILTVVLAVFALLELADLELFARWLGGALLAQLATIALLLFDGR
jgi:D-glycero-D-manno-heptose 1,7-bisphosphate phosphatase